jgi:uncharacterized protein YdeI (YjbR/CyaY-like superfamily)
MAPHETPPNPKKAPATPRPSKVPEPIVRFASAAAFDRFLATHHTDSGAVLLTLGKGGHPPHITYAEALDVALRWGWIDSQKRKLDDTAWLQRFGPRTKTSPWSKINVAKAEALIAAGTMTPSGLREVERAKADGRWARAYDSPKTITVPPDLASALAASPKAEALFGKLDSTNRYAILYRLIGLKTEAGRRRKIETFVAMLARGEVPYPDRLPR